jgi:hypothetical protein
MKFLGGSGVFDYAGLNSSSRYRACSCCLPRITKTSASGLHLFNTNAVLGTLAAQPDADGIIFDKATGLVLVVSGDNGVLMTLKPDVDPKTGSIDPLLLTLLWSPSQAPTR